MTGDDDAFFDVLVGVDRVSRLVAAVLDDAMLAGAEPPSAFSEDPPEDRPGDLPDDLPADLIDAVLGLVSLRTTADLVLAALSSDVADAEPVAGDGATWSRELLR